MGYVKRLAKHVLTYIAHLRERCAKTLFLLLAFPLLLACRPDAPTYHGYVEGEYISLAPTTSGILETLSVARGQRVDKNAPLFSLDTTNLEAARFSAEAEIDKAEATLLATQKEYARLKALAPSGAVSRSDLDAQKAALDGTTAAVKAAKQKLIQIKKQIVEAAPHAPAAGAVENTFFRPGEFIAAGTPVVSMLPPENVKLRFFVPQADIPNLRPGAPIVVTCDGCKAPIPATITFIATKSEYTPPIIYSIGSRDKLVFMIEAKPDAFAPELRPGLPVDIEVPAP